MGLADIVRGGVATINRVVGVGASGGLQETVTHEAYVGSDSYGKPQFATPIALSALVDKDPRLIRLTTGQEVKPRAGVMFLAPVSPNGASGRDEPVDVRDRIVLPGGMTGPILNVDGGLIDSGTGAPYTITVYLG